MCLAIVASDGKLECALSLDCSPIVDPVNLSFVFVEMQVLKEMGFVWNAF